MNTVFLMDSLETVNAKKDTTLALMNGAHKKGHKVYHLPEGNISKLPTGLHFQVTEVIPKMDQEFPFEIKEEQILTEKDVDVVFIRTDPPFDEEYLMQTWLLDLLPEHIAVINKPSGIRSANEKIWATQFKDIIPETLVSQNRDELIKFISDGEQYIGKPTNRHGGQSVFFINKSDTNANVILETLTKNYTEEMILQKYIPESEIGDKRILLLDGEPLGAVLRVHSKDDHRNNFFSGGKAQKAKIKKNDLKIINVLKPHLTKLGLHFVGIDVIGEYLVEVNVTSPTCLQEINHFNQASLEDEVIAFAEKMVDEKKNNDRILTN